MNWETESRPEQLRPICAISFINDCLEEIASRLLKEMKPDVRWSFYKRFCECVDRIHFKGLKNVLYLEV
jgi:hypothetical protein